MIRKLTEADREPLMTLLQKEPALNLFLIGDVENFGFKADFMELWGEMDAEGTPIKAVMLRYFRSYIPFADGPFDVLGFREILRQDTQMQMISGISGIVQPFADVMTFRKEKQMYFAEMKQLQRKSITPSGSALPLIKKAAVDDVEAICLLTDQIEEFEEGSENARNNLRHSITTGTGRTYYIEQDGRVVATASTGAENSVSAMLVGVATHPEFRGQGLASAVVERLCADLLHEEKALCLFYDNPLAGALYKRLGFQDIGFWTMAYV